VYSNIADISYKRLTRTISVPAGGGNLSFWISRDTEPDWDFVFVEAHTVGQDDWTTLPDANGHTSQSTGPERPEPGELPGRLARAAPVARPLPDAERRQLVLADGHDGRVERGERPVAGLGAVVDRPRRVRGKQVEVSIAYASDWSFQGLGTFVDDITLPTGESTSFETDLGGWTVTGPPPGSAPNSNNFARTTAGGFPEGAVVATPDTPTWASGWKASPHPLRERGDAQVDELPAALTQDLPRAGLGKPRPRKLGGSGAPPGVAARPSR
jgi:hypothetical protein